MHTTTATLIDTWAAYTADPPAIAYIGWAMILSGIVLLGVAVLARPHGIHARLSDLLAAGACGLAVTTAGVYLFATNATPTEDDLADVVADHLADTYDLVAVSPMEITPPGISVDALDATGDTHTVTITFRAPLADADALPEAAATTTVTIDGREQVHP